MFVAGDPDFAAGVLAEQHPVSLVNVERVQLAVFIDASVPDREHLALHRFLLGSIGDDQTALGLAFPVDALHEDPIVERPYLRHARRLPSRPAHEGHTGLNSNGWIVEWSRLHRMQLTSIDAWGANGERRLIESSERRWMGGNSPYGSMGILGSSVLLMIH
jgi:hypothetical protein